MDSLPAKILSFRLLFFFTFILCLSFVPDRGTVWAQTSSRKSISDIDSLQVNKKDVASDTRASDETDADDESGADDELGDDELDNLLNSDLEDLGKQDVVVPVFNEEVTTVSRRESTIGKSAAAVYVITNEMIRRSGARSIPEALRLAPGLQVARIDANKWSISIRGFNQRFANKLLVQIDGRTVYTPLFAGVFWDVQDVLLEDIDRIEIVRGPGGTLWGANAVNGIINIITKSSKDTMGLFGQAGVGSERAFSGGRIGGQIGQLHWRAYGKWFDRDKGFSPGFPATDQWHVARGGFRMDWTPNDSDTVTVQGDYYDGDAAQNQFTPTTVAPFFTVGPENQIIKGGNYLWRWSRKVDDETDWSLQFYYDRTERHLVPNGFREDRDTIDIDFQNRFQFGPSQSIVYGFGYRNSRDNIRNDGFALRYFPPTRSDDTFSTFVQDEINLIDDLMKLTIGSKFSWNNYTNFEYQPSIRFLLTPSERKTIWASVSRAVRVPSRTSANIHLITPPSSVPAFPTFFNPRGNPNVVSEELLAWEAGIRSAPIDHFFWDLAVFYNHYENIQSLQTGTPGFDPISGLVVVPFHFNNELDGKSIGFELASNIELQENWSVRGGYNFLRLFMDPSPLAFADAGAAEGQNPRNSFFMHSSLDIGNHWEWDVMGRYSDYLPAESIPSYFQLDTRIAWNPTEHFEFAVVGRNLLDNSQPEFGSDVYTGVIATEVRREVFGVITCRY